MTVKVCGEPPECADHMVLVRVLVHLAVGGTLAAKHELQIVDDDVADVVENDRLGHRLQHVVERVLAVEVHEEEGQLAELLGHVVEELAVGGEVELGELRDEHLG